MIRNVTKSRSFPAIAPHSSRILSKSIPICQHRRSYAVRTDEATLSNVGDRAHGFTLQRIKGVPELNLTAKHLSHDTTGAQYLHVARDDKNNVFAISFKTNPTDDTGLPHILEHVSLCGSQQFPVRDPFFKMMPRSLSNFMNAFTSSDYTSYPFATTNKQDFQNLSSVYLDATLRPLLKKSDFLQEGWRLGPENPRDQDSSSDVRLKGVVYNEMKGQMSDSSYLFYVRFRDHIFPALHNSGGDPQKMTNLTHEQLVNFHKRNYHPSNARIFSYGDLDLSNQLELVNTHLGGFQKAEAGDDVKSALDLGGGPFEAVVSGPIDTLQSPDRQYKSSVSWNTCQTSDLVETFSLSIMSSLLLSGYGSPLYRGLIESGLGLGYSSNTGFDTSANVAMFTLGLDGMRKEDTSTLKSAIVRILEQSSDEAFEPHKVDGLLHQLELALKHKTSSFGMGLLDKLLPGWFNGADPLESLSWNSIIDAFKQRYSQGGYLQDLLAKYILNDRCFIFTMEPAETYHSDLDAQELVRKEQALSSVEKELNSSADEAVKHLRNQELELLLEQEDAKNSNVDCLPTLHVQDIPKEIERKPIEIIEIGNVELIQRETATNGITYFQAKHIIENLPKELRLLLPLFTDCLMRLGTRTRSVGELEDTILLKTGGISISPFTRPDPLSLQGATEGLVISGHALDGNVPALLDLTKTLLLEIDFSGDKAMAAVMELLESKASGALDSIAEAGNAFASMSASAALSRSSRLEEEKSGLSQVDAISQLLRQARNDPDSLRSVVERLQHIQQFAVSNSSQLAIRMVCEPSAVGANQQQLANFISNLPNGSSPLPPLPSAQSVNSDATSLRTFFDLPYQVSYTGSCFRTVNYDNPASAPLAILGQLLTHHYLHPEIREKGGAYGASANASPISGLFSMSSYRDPNPRKTLQTFQKAGVFARDRAWTSRELEEAKLGLFQRIDAPRDVSSEGAKEFMSGVTEDMEQPRRQRLLEVKPEDVQMAADQFLSQAKPDEQSVTILGESKSWLNDLPEKYTVRRLNVAQE
ncbi:MAG: hypothetical protein Q9160_006933 [Pyrenula sp. 1 TL-2023]